MPVSLYFFMLASHLHPVYLSLTGAGESIISSNSGPILGGDTGWKFTIQGFWPRDHGDGHHPFGGSKRTAHATEGVPFGWDSFALPPFTPYLLCRAEPPPRSQHPL